MRPTPEERRKLLAIRPQLIKLIEVHKTELALVNEMRQAITHRLQLLIQLRDMNLISGTLENILKELALYAQPDDNEPKT